MNIGTMGDWHKQSDSLDELALSHAMGAYTLGGDNIGYIHFQGEWRSEAEVRQLLATAGWSATP